MSDVTAPVKPIENPAGSASDDDIDSTLDELMKEGGAQVDDTAPVAGPTLATPSQIAAVSQQMADKYSFTPEELSGLIAAEVAKALAAKGVEPDKELGPKSKSFVRVRATGTYVIMLNKHMQNIENFDLEVTMPKDYNMGDLRRSLPNKMAKLYPNMKRLRHIASHEIVGAAHADAATGEVESDFIAPAPVIATKENTEGDDTSATGEPKAAGEVGDTSEYGADGLPPIVNK